MKISDAVCIIFIVIGLALTAMNVFVSRKPIADVENVTIRERPPIIPFF